MKHQTLLWFALVVSLLARQPAGSQWAPVPGPPGGHVWCYSIPAETTGASFFAGTDGGIYRSTDQGGTWWAVNNGLTYCCVASLLAYPPDMLAGAGNGIWRSTDDGDTWSQILLLNWGVTSLILGPDSGDTQALFAATSSWYASEGGILRSTDSGQSWIPAGLDTIDARDLAVAPCSVSSSAPCLYAATDEGIFRTCDGGRTWSSLDSASRPVGSLAIRTGPDSTPVLYAGTYFDGVFRSTDLGSTWSTLNSGLPVLEVSSLLAVRTDNQDARDLLLASVASHGVYLLSDTTNSWTEINSGLYNPRVPSLAASRYHLFAGTYGDGIFRRQLSDILTTIQAASSAQPKAVNLLQNYPNPFNGRTTITFELPSGGTVTISVFDLLGRDIATLCNERFSSGTHSISWNPSNVSSGIYLYRLTVGATSQVKLLQLLK